MSKRMTILDLFLAYWFEVESRPNSIDLGMGMPIPKSIYSKDILIPELKDGLNFRADYQPQLGNLHVRNSIAQLEAKKTGIEYSINNIMLVAGGIRGFSLLIDEFSDPKTIYFELLPSYPLLSGYVEMTTVKKGGKVIKVKSDIANKLKFNIDEIISQSEPNSIVFITNPNNPTGMYYPYQLLEELANQLFKRNSYLVIDESCNIPYENQPNPKYFALPNVIRIKSHSKDLFLAGFRTGYIVADESIIHKLSNRYIFSDGNPPVVVNRAIQKYCEQNDVFSTQLRKYCSKQYDYIYRSLMNTHSFDFVSAPQACYYLLAKAKLNLSSWDTFLKLLDNGVNVVPGILFGLPYDEAWIRICFARELSDIDNAVQIISSTLAKQ